MFFLLYVLSFPVRNTIIYNMLNFVEQNNEFAKTSGTCLFCLAGSVHSDPVGHGTYLVSDKFLKCIFQAEPADETKSVFTYEIQRDFYTFKNGNYFIGFRQVGKLKRISATENGRNVKKNKRFVYVPRGGSRKRRDPSEERPRRSAVGRRSGHLFGDDLQ